jgi:hypothetical protein
MFGRRMMKTARLLPAETLAAFNQGGAAKMKLFKHKNKLIDILQS